MAVIDIVGEKLAWLKSAQGFDGFDGPRCGSYCHHPGQNPHPVWSTLDNRHLQRRLRDRCRGRAHRRAGEPGRRALYRAKAHGRNRVEPMTIGPTTPKRVTIRSYGATRNSRPAAASETRPALTYGYHRYRAETAD
ncbi:hypothetical protein MMAN_57270 [Mycobacterium mantenii]|uniref:Uncharacterized protein n=1 Tax=Mycobacterium mantenii TaxID=560555 RepID=A0ABN6AI76_MYCNT|nr:hypothetical protein MMAN_57270 [Mycobacterium mantenii]